MSDDKQQNIRTIEQVTDDEIVDAIARRGLLGIDMDDWHPGNALYQVCVELRLATMVGPNLFDKNGDETDIDVDLSQHIHELCTDAEDARLHISISNFVMLTPREWARRLAGLREDSITAILSGKPQPTDDLTDDEIRRFAFGPNAS